MTRCLLSFLLVATAASPVFGQQPLGAIRGIVRDASGAALPAAAATLHNRETNVARSAETGADGQFVLAAVPPGLYRLELAAPGFKTHVEEFELSVNQDLRIDDVILQVGAASERVLVTGSGLALDRDSPALGAVVDNRQVVGLQHVDKVVRIDQFGPR